LYFIGLFAIDKEQFPLKKGGQGVVKTRYDESTGYLQIDIVRVT